MYYLLLRCYLVFHQFVKGNMYHLGTTQEYTSTRRSRWLVFTWSSKLMWWMKTAQNESITTFEYYSILALFYVEYLAT